ncbi:phage tail protein [Zobellella aerophila]|uniref:Phage tail collar domain-containing protein n=1 Tax=Zobellella aerophila TaxID=870480 RepID=A0ABP6VDZ3_9GAMM
MQDTLTMGTILPLGITFAPRNAYPCDGRLLAITEETALYSLMGDAFGGDGRVTFGLPDLRGRAAVGTGQGPGLYDYDLGQRAGSPTQILSTLHLPSHSHQAAIDITSASADITVTSTLYVKGGQGNTPTAEGNYLATATAGLSPVTNGYSNTADSPLNGGAIRSNAQLSDLQIQGDVAVGNSGGSQSFPIQSPVQAVTYVILGSGAGQYPQRS